ncbi:histone [Corynebacterium diphtheriae bv. gravis str. ISS 4746]|uniref:Lsr2 dimerization domain-containing protein n=1 Tax=Corynebacterium diphtheriae TaxID=1717 RepID=UPI00064C5DF4|nr:histone-like nucleoid-structuring protein Lsr2 [Corynebacterium diphtheriae]KLN37611.1 histone [Corynebacterium diphtheriae bv. gravis str. ISS 4746]
MARREITQYFDDIDNTPLTEDQVHVVRFGVNGINYVLDLSADNAQKHDYQVADRGKIPSNVIEAFLKSTKR